MSRSIPCTMCIQLFKRLREFLAYLKNWRQTQTKIPILFDQSCLKLYLMSQNSRILIECAHCKFIDPRGWSQSLRKFEELIIRFHLKAFLRWEKNCYTRRRLWVLTNICSWMVTFSLLQGCAQKLRAWTLGTSIQPREYPATGVKMSISSYSKVRLQHGSEAVTDWNRGYPEGEAY